MTHYHGGKIRIGKDIAEAIAAESDRICRETGFVVRGYCEPFCGMLGVYRHIPDLLNSRHPGIRYKAGDINECVIAMWKAAKHGWKPPTFVSHESYLKLKESTDEVSALRGFAGHQYGYSGRFFLGQYKGVWAPHKVDATAVSESIQRIGALAKSNRVRFKSDDYTQYTAMKGFIFYCDPPYNKTDCVYYKAGTRVSFDSEAFWLWCAEMARHNIVFVSETVQPQGNVRCVWQKTKTVNHLGSGSVKLSEQLFLVGKRLTLGTDCSGIDAPAYALSHDLGLQFDYLFASETDKHLRTFLKESSPAPRVVYDNVMTRDNSAAPRVDVYVAGFPCQSFSTLGTQQGFKDDRGSVFWGVLEYIQTKQPRFFLLENVASLLTHDHGNTWRMVHGALHDLSDYSVDHKVMSPVNYGFPHSRNRLFIIGLHKSCFGNFKHTYPPLSDSLVDIDTLLVDNQQAEAWEPSCVRPIPPCAESTITETLRLGRDKGIDVTEETCFVDVSFKLPKCQIRWNRPRVVTCLHTQSYNVYITNRARFITGREMLALQGFPHTHCDSLKYRTRIIRAAGNSMCVPLISQILRPYLEHMGFIKDTQEVKDAVQQLMARLQPMLTKADGIVAGILKDCDKRGVKRVREQVLVDNMFKAADAAEIDRPTFSVHNYQIVCNLKVDDVLRDYRRLQHRQLGAVFVKNGHWARTVRGAPLPKLLAVFNPASRVGSRLSMLYHWKGRCSASSVNRLSAETVLREWRNKVRQTVPNALARMGCTPYEAVRLNSALQSVSHFRPSVAFVLCDMLKPRRCLDFAAGWGDRLTGFLASDCVEEITLIDPRCDAIEGYKRQVQLVRSVKSVRYICDAAESVLPSFAEDVLFDLVLTSPPYSNLEMYDDGPLQVYKRYTNNESYLKQFLFKVVDEVLKRLSPEGVLALNISDNKEHAVDICQPFLDFIRRKPGFRLACTLGYSTRSNPGYRSTNSEDRMSGEPLYVVCRKDQVLKVRRQIEEYITSHNVRVESVFVADVPPKKRLLDLFTGTGSISRVARSKGYEVRSLDMDESRKATYTTDIMKFDYETELADFVPDVIWASPPCTEYSRAKSKGVRDIEGANMIVRRVLDIIEWAKKRNPNVAFFIENPQTGLLKDQDIMWGLPYCDTDYCCYGFPYRKRTRIWTNSGLKDLPFCPGKGVCKQMVGRRHRVNIGNGRPGITDYRPSLGLKYSIPKKLIKLILPSV